MPTDVEREHLFLLGPILEAYADGGDEIIGWGTWIRTKIDGVRVRSSTVELSPKRPVQCASSRGDRAVNSEANAAAQALRSTRNREFAVVFRRRPRRNARAARVKRARRPRRPALP